LLKLLEILDKEKLNREKLREVRQREVGQREVGQEERRKGRKEEIIKKNFNFASKEG
jgi:hypothetical protein